MTADGQLARDDWLVHADFRAKSVRNGPDQHFCCRRRHFPGRRNTPTDILDEQSAVGIEHHFDHRAFIKGQSWSPSASLSFLTSLAWDEG